MGVFKEKNRFFESLTSAISIRCFPTDAPPPMTGNASHHGGSGRGRTKATHRDSEGGLWEAIYSTNTNIIRVGTERGRNCMPEAGAAPLLCSVAPTVKFCAPPHTSNCNTRPHGGSPASAAPMSAGQPSGCSNRKVRLVSSWREASQEAMALMLRTLTTSPAGPVWTGSEKLSHHSG